MLFDLKQLKKNKLRAKKIGKKNFLLHTAYKSLEGRVIDLGLSLEKIMVFGAKGSEPAPPPAPEPQKDSKPDISINIDGDDW